MYTTGSALRLFARVAELDARDVTHPGLIVFELDETFDVWPTLIELGVVEHHVKAVGEFTEHRIQLTELGRVVWREQQRHFEELLHKARQAADERLRLRRQRTLELDRTNDR